MMDEMKKRYNGKNDNPNESSKPMDSVDTVSLPTSHERSGGNN
jgi:hypothetical protein